MYRRKLDTTYLVNTPEGIEIELSVAGPVARAYAWATDFAIRAVIYIAVIFATQSIFINGDFNDRSPEFIAGVYSILVFMLEWLYPTLFEALTGSTPGKRLLKLRVIQDNGTPVTLPSSIIRNFLRAADFLPVFYATGLITMANNSAFKRLGDLAAGTLVVHDPKPPTAAPFTHTESLPLPTTINAEEKIAIVRFAERSSSLSVERQIELANLLTNLTGQTGEPAVNTLKAWSHWIMSGQEYAETNSI